MKLTIELVRRVRPAVEAFVRRTPMVESAWLSQETGKRVFLKCENLQLTGSFKVRGALAAIAELDDESRAAGVLTCSTGNHGQGLAFAAAQAGVSCKVVVPRDAAKNKVAKILGSGAEVVEAPGEGYDEALAWMFDNAEELGGTYVSAFEDPAIIAGNGGTTALEIFEDLPAADTVVVPAGGGGLICGVGLVARDFAPTARVIGVNPKRSPALWMSRRDGRAFTTLEPAQTLADGVEGGVGAENFELAKTLVDDVVCVSEVSIESAMREILLREKLLIEGAAALGVAALLEHDLPGDCVVIILSGGNLDPAVLRRIFE